MPSKKKTPPPKIERKRVTHSGRLKTTKNWDGPGGPL